MRLPFLHFFQFKAVSKRFFTKQVFNRLNKLRNMAVVQNPVTGRSKNKFANAIFQTWKGINTMRSKPLSVANPKSQAQTIQRVKLATIVQVYRAIQQAIKLGYYEQAIQKSEYNAFVQENIMPAIDVDPSTYEPTIQYSLLKMAKGSLSTPQDFQVSNTGNTLNFLWVGTGITQPDAANDRLVCLAYNPTAEDWAINLNVAVRSAGLASYALPMTFTGDTYIYTFFVSANGRKSSDSQFVDLAL